VTDIDSPEARPSGGRRLTELLEPRPDDGTTAAVYTATDEVSRAELHDRAGRLAAVLRHAGLQPGQAVGVSLANGPDVVAALFGVWFAGGVYIPLNPRLSDDEVAHVLASDRPAVIVTDAAPEGRFHGLPVVLHTDGGGWAAPADSVAASSDEGEARAYDADVALIQFTSGTTGRPKPVLLRHSGVLELLDPVIDKLRGGADAAGGNEGGERKAPMPNLIPTSLSLWAGIYNVLFAFRVGAAVILMDRFDTKAFAGFVQRFGLKSSVLPPAALTMLNDDEAVTTLEPMKYVRSITAPLSPLQARRFRERFGIVVLNCWGQTEIGGEIVGWSARDAREWGDTHLGAVGRPHEGVRIRITGPEGQEMPTNEQGEICVQTPALMSGFADGSDVSERMIDGWFRTGDIGRVDPEGFLWIEGRVSDMINRGGLKVFPEEVAEVIRLSPDVSECAVAGIPDDRLGEVPWAFVVLREGAALDDHALGELCREHLAPYKVPVRFVQLDALPRNEVGKILLRELVRIGTEN
jgi:acyl-CoA synthetase (AMP-forming)/AMP-acid ligase II